MADLKKTCKGTFALAGLVLWGACYVDSFSFKNSELGFNQNQSTQIIKRDEDSGRYLVNNLEEAVSKGLNKNYEVQFENNGRKKVMICLGKDNGEYLFGITSDDRMKYSDFEKDGYKITHIAKPQK